MVKWNTSNSLLLCIILFCGVSAVSATLKFAIFFHRHGSRGPINPKTQGEHWNQHEQLTAVGMRQLYLMGAEVRKRYVEEQKLLPENYDPNTIYVRSTQVNRTLQSAGSFLAGLYPAGTGPNLPKDYPQERAVPPFETGFDPTPLGQAALPLNFQPVPIHSTDYTKDYTFLASSDAVCPAMKQFKTSSLNSAEVKAVMTEFDPVVAEVAKVFKIPKEQITLGVMSNICDTLMMSYMDNKPLPVEVGSDLFNRMLAFLNISTVMEPYATRHQIKVFSTKMIEEFLNKLDGAVSGKAPLKFAHYSAHDTTLNLLLSAINVTSWQCLFQNYKDGKFTTNDYKCPFGARLASNIMIELHSKEDGTNFIRLFYDDVQYPVFGDMDIEYTKFKAGLQSIQVPNFFDDCQGPPVSAEKIPVWQIAVLVIQAIFVIASAWYFISSYLSFRKVSSLEEPMTAAEA